MSGDTRTPQHPIVQYLKGGWLVPAEIHHGLRIRVKVLLSSTVAEEPESIVRAFVKINDVKAKLAAGAVSRARFERTSCTMMW
jgi:hypothetical protein